MLTVLTGSTDELLTTPQRLRDYLGATSTSDVLDRMVAVASKAVQTHLGYPVLRQRYQETVPSFGDSRLMLARTPICTIERLFDGTDTGTDNEVRSSEYTVENAEAGLLWRDIGWPWSAQPYMGFVESERRPGTERRRWLVEYAAGYIFTQASSDGYGTTSTGYGTTSTGPTLPADIEQAVLDTAKSMWLMRKANPNVQSKSVGDLSINYRSDTYDAAVPESAQALLRPYRRVSL